MKVKTKTLTINVRAPNRGISHLTFLLAHNWEIAHSLSVGEDAYYILTRQVPWWRRLWAWSRDEEVVFPENKGEAVFKA